MAVNRYLFNLLAALSLILCVGTSTQWVRSYWRVDCIEYAHALTVERVRCDGGAIWFERKWYPPNFPPQNGDETGKIVPKGLTLRLDSPRAMSNAWLWDVTVSIACTTGTDRTGWNWRKFGFGVTGFRAAHPASQLPNLMWIVLVPFWFPFASTCILPLWWGLQRKRELHLRRSTINVPRAVTTSAPRLTDARNVEQFLECQNNFNRSRGTIVNETRLPMAVERTSGDLVGTMRGDSGHLGVHS